MASMSSQAAIVKGVINVSQALGNAVFKPDAPAIPPLARDGETMFGAF